MNHPTTAPMTWHWTREAALSQQASVRPQSETWSLQLQGQKRWSGQVEVHCGKPLNLRALKGTDLKEWREYADFIRDTSHKLYTPEQTAPVEACPCCTGGLDGASPLLNIWGIDYLQCPHCHHVFVGRQPLPEVINRLFRESETHSETYTDPERLEVRLQQVVQPKLDWVLERYQKLYGRRPASLMDVGAGGGHFVEVARRAGLAARGVEISQSSCRFAQQNFGISLEQVDFLGLPSEQKLDVLTFWGLLEYIQQPGAFLRAAREKLADQGLLIVEVPRVDSLSTAIQQHSDAFVARHLDPTSHVNCFSDASMLTALWQAGFEPVAAWYFGMDIYEVLIQIQLLNARSDLPDASLDIIPVLQGYLDRALLGDDLIIAAVPRKEFTATESARS